MCLSASHQADGVLHGEDLPLLALIASRRHGGAENGRKGSLAASDARKGGGAMSIATFADGAKKKKKDVLSDTGPNDHSK